MAAPTLVGVVVASVIARARIDDGDYHRSVWIVARVSAIQVIAIVVAEAHRLALYLVARPRGR